MTPGSSKVGVASIRRHLSLRGWLSAITVVVGLAGIPAAVTADSLDKFDWRATVVLNGTGALHSVTLPASAYAYSRGRSLADLRVFNASGESLPFALEQSGESRLTPTQRSVQAVPLRLTDPPGSATGLPQVSLRYEGTNLSLSVQGQPAADSSTGGKIAAWFFDLKSPQDAALSPVAYRALRLKLSSGPDFQTSVMLEGSDDLRQWHTLAAQAPLLRAGRESQTILHDRIEFAATRWRYLRLSWPAAMGEIRIESASIEDEPALAPVQWQRLRLQGQLAIEAGESVIQYANSARVPVNRVQLVLPQINTILPVRIESRDQDTQPWQPRASASFYRLAPSTAGGAEILAPEQRAGAGLVDDRWWRVRLDRRAGDVDKQPPELELIWPAQRVVFAARGNPPFTLALGRSRMAPAALPLESIIPGYRADLPSPASPATLAAEQTRPRSNHWADDIDPQQAGMWAALVAAVSTLGWVAWRLMRKPPTT